MNKSVMNDKMQEIYGGIYPALKKNNYSVVSRFVPVIGDEYWKSPKLMLIGRATNGWSLFDVQKCEKETFCSATTKSEVNDKDIFYDFTSWLNDNGVEKKPYDGEHYYNTNRSAFFRTARNFLCELENGKLNAPWFKYCVWTNLFPISPEEGNPNDGLIGTQLCQSIALLKEEIRYFAPNRILFITGSWWFSRFAELFGFNVEKDDTDHYVQAEGKYNGIPWVMTIRPEGKKDGRMLDEIKSAFARLGDK